MSRRRVVRLIVMPLLILAVAWGLSVATRHRHVGEIATFERAVTAWCEAAARGEEPPVPVAPELPRLRVVEAIRSVCRKDDHPAAWSIAVAAGPGTAPPGSATHHAMIRVDGRDALGLGLGLPGGRPLVVGYWLVP